MKNELNNPYSPFIRLYLNGYYPRGVVDIGAHIGSFTMNLRYIWPKSKYIAFEANPACKIHLDKLPIESRICLLGDTEKDVTFYIDSKNLLSTGNSIYLEQSTYFEKPLEIKLKQKLLENELNNPNQYDLIKIDVQGSELNVLRGAENILQNFTFVYLEISITQCNEGSPLFPQVYQYMKSRNYDLYDLCEFTYTNNVLLQINVLFKRN